MRKDTALYVGNDYQRRGRLNGHLQSLGFDMHKTSSILAAKQKLQDQPHNLLLIQFELVRKQILDFLSFVRHEDHEAVIMVLMAEVRPYIESRLFDNGADDVVAGRQTFPAALASRIKRRFYNGRLSLPKTNRIMLKGGALVDLDRGEVRLNGFSHKLKGVLDKLFRYFLNNPHRAISRDELIKSHIWDNSVCLPDKIEGGRAVDMAVTRLRRLIESNPSCPQIIITIYGVGWILAKDSTI
jgi:DNA-binding response OmpR family regulator